MSGTEPFQLGIRIVALFSSIPYPRHISFVLIYSYLFQPKLRHFIAFANSSAAFNLESSSSSFLLGLLVA